MGGEQASVADAGAEGACLDNKSHNSSYLYRDKDTRQFTKPESEIKVCVEGSGIKVTIKKDIPGRISRSSLEDIYCAPGFEDNRERAIALLKFLKGRKRGIITKCSKQSCRRLREKISELKRTENPIFVGLTFPDQFPNPREAHKYLKNFLQRVERTFQGTGVFWKMEIKPRLSGENKGEEAPHFHLFVYGAEYDVFKKWAKKAWWGVVGSEDYWHRRKGCNVTEVYDLRGIKVYLRKYFSKDFEVKGVDGIGRTWGYVGNIPWGEVRKITVETKVAYALLRTLQKLQNSRHKEWAKLNRRFLYRPPHKGKRAFDTEEPERMLELIELLEWNYVPF